MLGYCGGGLGGDEGCGGATHAPNLSPCGAAGLCWDGECVQLPGAMKSAPAECTAD